MRDRLFFQNGYLLQLQAPFSQRFLSGEDIHNLLFGNVSVSLQDDEDNPQTKSPLSLLPMLVVFKFYERIFLYVTTIFFAYDHQY